MFSIEAPLAVFLEVFYVVSNTSEVFHPGNALRYMTGSEIKVNIIDIHKTTPNAH